MALTTIRHRANDPVIDNERISQGYFSGESGEKNAGVMANFGRDGHVMYSDVLPEGMIKL